MSSHDEQIWDEVGGILFCIQRSRVEWPIRFPLMTISLCLRFGTVRISFSLFFTEFRGFISPARCPEANVSVVFLLFSALI